MRFTELTNQCDPDFDLGDHLALAVDGTYSVSDTGDIEMTAFQNEVDIEGSIVNVFLGSAASNTECFNIAGLSGVTTPTEFSFARKFVYKG